MMNVLALCLVLTSLVMGGVWSPTPENPNQNQNPNLIVTEGHRVVVVEYEKGGDGNTKVVISPADDKGGGFVHAAEEKLSEAASATKGAVEDVKDKVKDAAFRPKELVCDAFGKCKHKIASALGKTKDKVSETAHEVSEKVHEVEEHAKDAYEKAKDAVTEKTHEGVEKAQEMGESTKDAAGKLKKKTEGTAKDTAKKIEDFDMVDSPKRIGEDIEHNVSKKGEGATEVVKEMAKHTEEAAEDVKEKGKKSLNEILNKGREFAYDFICYLLPLKRLDAVVDVVHLLGVSMAYGMTMFVSFVSSYVLSRTLTKQQFGMVQSKLYPVYHKLLGVSVGVGLLGHLLGQRRRVFSNKLEMFQALDLLAALSTVLVNALFLEPRATKLMFERMKIDKEEGKGQTDDPRGGVAGGFGDPVCVSSAIGAVETREEPSERHDITRMTEQLKKLNMYSSILNMFTLIFLSWHLVYLGHRLQLSR